MFGLGMLCPERLTKLLNKIASVLKFGHYDFAFTIIARISRLTNKGLRNMLFSLIAILPIAAFADDHSTMRVVAVQTDDVDAYRAQLSIGMQMIKKVEPKMTIRAWQATFAGDSTGAVIVAVEHPGSLGDWANAWDKIQADKAVADWLAGLGGLRKIVSDSLYNEMPL